MTKFITVYTQFEVKDLSRPKADNFDPPFYKDVIEKVSINIDHIISIADIAPTSMEHIDGYNVEMCSRIQVNFVKGTRRYYSQLTRTELEYNANRIVDAQLIPAAVWKS